MLTKTLNRGKENTRGSGKAKLQETPSTSGARGSLQKKRLEFSKLIFYKLAAQRRVSVELNPDPCRWLVLIFLRGRFMKLVLPGLEKPQSAFSCCHGLALVPQWRRSVSGEILTGSRQEGASPSSSSSPAIPSRASQGSSQQSTSHSSPGKEGRG